MKLNICRPHQAAPTAWANGRGFEVKDSTGELAIASANIISDDMVITLAADPNGANLLLRYALTQDGPGRQGETNRRHDREAKELEHPADSVKPVPGPSGIADLTFHHDQHNYCVQFELAVSG